MANVSSLARPVVFTFSLACLHGSSCSIQAVIDKNYDMWCALPALDLVPCGFPVAQVRSPRLTLKIPFVQLWKIKSASAASTVAMWLVLRAVECISSMTRDACIDCPCARTFTYTRAAQTKSARGAVGLCSYPTSGHILETAAC